MKKLSEIQVVVLMGGKGSRLKSKKPKAMVDVYGKPFFQYQLELMKNRGFKKFLFCIGYKGDLIKKYFKNGKDLGVSIKYSKDGKTLLGTGGALRKAISLLENNFILIYGDSFMNVDYQAIICKYIEIKTKALMVVYKNKNRCDTSNVMFRNNKIVYYSKYFQMTTMDHIDYGIAMIDKVLVRNIRKNKYVDLSVVYSYWVTQKIMKGYEVQNRFYEIGSPKSLKELRQYIKNRRI